MTAFVIIICRSQMLWSLQNIYINISDEKNAFCKKCLIDKGYNNTIYRRIKDITIQYI